MNWLRRLSLTSIMAACLLSGLPVGARAKTVPTTPSGPADPGLSAEQPANAGTAQLRIVQTSTDRAPVDLIIGGRPRLYNFPPGATSAYLAVKADLLAVTVRPSDVGSTALPIDIEIQMKADAKATLFPLKGGTAPGAVLVPDDLPPATPAAAAVRFIHLGSTAATLTVEAGGIGSKVDAYRATGFMSVPPGSVPISIRSAPNGPALLEYSLPVGAGQVVSMLILDGPSGPQLVAMSQRDATPVEPAATDTSAVTTAPTPPAGTNAPGPTAATSVPTGGPGRPEDGDPYSDSASVSSPVSARAGTADRSTSTAPDLLALSGDREDTHAGRDVGRLVALGGLAALAASTGRRRHPRPVRPKR